MPPSDEIDRGQLHVLHGPGSPIPGLLRNRVRDAEATVRAAEAAACSAERALAEAYRRLAAVRSDLVIYLERHPDASE